MENVDNGTPPDVSELEMDASMEPESYVQPTLTKHRPLHELTGKSAYQVGEKGLEKGFG